MVVTDSGWWLGIQPFLVPFLLSTAVIPCTTVKKLFVTFCWHRLWFHVWLWGGAWYTWGWSRIAVTTEPQEWHLSFETFKSMGIVNKKADNLQDRGCFSHQNNPLSQAGPAANLCCWLKSRPCKSHLICPSLEGRIKSNKTPGPKSWSWSWKSWRPPLKGWFASLKGRSHLICGPLQTTSNATKPSLHPPYNWYGQADKKNTGICMVFKCTAKQLLVSLRWICFQKLVKCKSSKKKIYRRQYGLVIHWITTGSN